MLPILGKATSPRLIKPPTYYLAGWLELPSKVFMTEKQWWSRGEITKSEESLCLSFLLSTMPVCLPDAINERKERGSNNQTKSSPGIWMSLPSAGCLSPKEINHSFFLSFFLPKLRAALGTVLVLRNNLWGCCNRELRPGISFSSLDVTNILQIFFAIVAVMCQIQIQL